MKDKLSLIIVLVAIFSISFGIFTYLGRYALCEDVKRVEQKTDKMMQIMDYKFKYMELKTTEERIYNIEKRYGVNPRDQNKKAELEKLRREREQILREMNEIKGGK